jgi:asparagine synthase (glutamine-hydrolysing)
VCGIVGIAYFDGEKIDKQVLEAAANKLAHRGPDASGIYIDNDGVPSVGLGHRRLSIIDLSASANQPLSNEHKDVWVIFNGEIYNFIKLRNQLKHNHRFVSNSDTEVIVHLYEQYGEDAIAMLDGMFAIAIYDQRKHRLILARDRVGKKPLYYYYDRKKLMFASEIKAILSLLSQEDIAINEQTLPFYLVYGYSRPPQTFYKGINQLVPASYAVYKDSGSMEIKEYWSLKEHILNNDTSVREYTKDDPLLRFKLTEAVKNRLIADVPLGAFLSGGIDSSIVTGLMSKLTDTPVKTFSIGFSEDVRYDETAYANIVAKRFKTDHHVFVVTPSTIELIDKIIYHYDEPFGDASAIPTYIVSNLTRQHVTVALNGDGGDELFAGYTRFIAATMSEGIPPLIRKLLSDMSGLIPAPHSEKSLLSRSKRLLSVLNKTFLERYVNWISYIRFDDISNLVNPMVFSGSVKNNYKDDVYSYFTQHLNGMEKTSLLTQLLYLNFKTYLPDDLLVKMDRMTMANSLEGRSPFLDRELIEYAFTIPDNLKLKGFNTKYNLKQTFRDILPKEVMHRGKMGFGVPLGTWFRTKLKSYMEEHLISDNPMIYTYLNAKEIKRIFDEHQNGVRDHGLKLWLFLSLELWLRNLKKGNIK